MVKILITTIQVNFVPIDQAAPNSPELLLLKFLPLTYHHSHFLAATLDFTSWLFLIRLYVLLFFSQISSSQPLQGIDNDDYDSDY